MSLGMPENKGCGKKWSWKKKKGGPEKKNVKFLAGGRILEMGEILEIWEL